MGLLAGLRPLKARILFEENFPQGKSRGESGGWGSYFGRPLLSWVAVPRAEKQLKMLIRGGGGPRLENLCEYFRCFVACTLPVGVGNNKPNSSQN